MVDRKNMSRVSMNALCSAEISLSTRRFSTLSASPRISKRSCKARWVGPYSRLIGHLLAVLTGPLPRRPTRVRDRSPDGSSEPGRVLLHRGFEQLEGFRRQRGELERQGVALLVVLDHQAGEHARLLR